MTIEKVREEFPNYVVDEFRGYIIIAQDKRDFEAKQKSICRGDVYGFYKNEK